MTLSACPNAQLVCNWAEIERHRGGSSAAPAKTIKQAEIETLLASPDEIGQDKIEGDFYARRWRPAPPLDAIS